jgi:hypothetical protein
MIMTDSLLKSQRIERVWLVSLDVRRNNEWFCVLNSLQKSGEPCQHNLVREEKEGAEFMLFGKTISR